ncbi:MAG TPA: hypothetical protein VFR38_08265 [Gaiellaceae bacterium]|nr:hypothetical protein [Gaiellaceae bacterium]
MSRSDVCDLVRVVGRASAEAESCSEGLYVISTERTATAFSRISGPSPWTTGTAIEMNVAAALSTTWGKGRTVATRENSGSGTHIRIAIATKCRRGTTTASAVLLVVRLLDVSSVVIRPQKPCRRTIEAFGTRGLPRLGYLTPSFEGH